MSHVVIMASKGRPQILEQTLRCIRQQTEMPSRLIVSVTSPSDLTPWIVEASQAAIVFSKEGLASQLNEAIRLLRDTDRYVTLFDDDVYPSQDYLKSSRLYFDQHAEVQAFDGVVICEKEMTEQAANQMFDSHPVSDAFFPGSQLYGCNMNVRTGLIRSLGFDESLPHYAWLYDLDFARRCQALGLIGRYSACRLVHRRVSVGRMSDRRFGYSQVANPIHLSRKKSLSWSESLFRFILAGMVSNLAHTLFSGESIAYRQRFSGNLLALRNWCAGRLSPGVINEI